ncbi:MAG: hypothetical protein ACJA1A_002468 [Saprospiraceae bacterium]|jgi:hypothetical protein
MQGKYKNFVILLYFAVGSISANAQNDHWFSVNLTGGLSKTGSLIYSDEYRKSINSVTVEILKVSSSRNSNFNFGIAYHPNRSILINGSIGVASYGFQYTGDVVASTVNTLSVGGFRVQESYKTRLMEVNLSAAYQLNFNEDVSFTIKPGMSWYTNPSENFQQTLGFTIKSNNFSATFFSGIEIPMIRNILYASVGVNAKVPLDNFASTYHLDSQFHPYALGLQTSISYRFWSRN